MKRKFNDFKKLNQNNDNLKINIKDLYDCIYDIYYYDYLNKLVEKYNIDLPIHLRMFLDQCSLCKSILNLKGKI